MDIEEAKNFSKKKNRSRRFDSTGERCNKNNKMAKTRC